MNKYKVLAINPGSTSTKIALFENKKELFREDMGIDGGGRFPNLSSQLGFRIESIIHVVEEKNFSLEEIDAYAVRGGGNMKPCPCGVYEIDEQLLNDNSLIEPVFHPLQLGCHIAAALRERYGGRAFTMNPQLVDELTDVARVTGIKGVWRTAAQHTLNQKEAARRVAEKYQKKYEETNMIVAHLGGGISISAHRKGRIVDSSHSGYGDGPIAPTRAGTVRADDVIKLIETGEYDSRELTMLFNIRGGLLHHLGTADIREIKERIAKGDRYADLVYHAMIYTVSKYIASLSIPMRGEIDYIVLTGGIAYDEQLVEAVAGKVGWIAPIEVVPGENEMEALAADTIRVLKGEEETVDYSLVRPFDPVIFVKDLQNGTIDFSE